MGGLDKLLTESMGAVIQENLGEKTISKINSRLFEKYGIQLSQAIEDFHKIDAILREIFGEAADALELKFLERICILQKNKGKNQTRISLEEPKLIKLMMETYGDEDKKEILTNLLENSQIISKVLQTCQIPQTSGYRKIKSLINSGLLLPDGFEIGSDGKKIQKYRSLFENVRIDIVKNKVKVVVHLSDKDLTQSSILTTVYA